jgi:hypothetical protein
LRVEIGLVVGLSITSSMSRLLRWPARLLLTALQVRGFFATHLQHKVESGRCRSADDRTRRTQSEEGAGQQPERRKPNEAGSNE